MPPEDFWEGVPSTFFSYLEAYKLRLKREEEINSQLIDYQAWLTGLYVHQAVGVVMQNAFSKGTKSKYLKEPISFTHTKEQKQKETKVNEDRLWAQFEGFRRLTDTMNGGLKKR